MSIEAIKTLSMNPHFIAKLIQAFITGYGKPCRIQHVFMAIPILFHEPARKKLLTANNASRMESLYGKKDNLPNGEQISSQSQMAGFIRRYELLQPYVKQAIIIGCNDQILEFCNDQKLQCLINLNYSQKGFSKPISKWIRTANYLGKVFRNATPEQLSYILEVELP